MPSTQRLQFITEIAAPPAEVSARMTALESYRDWTRAFCDGSTYEGSWEPGARIRFLAPSGDGMVAEIAEHRPGAFISIRHLGWVVKGVDDTESDSVRAWAPAYENYRFEPVPGGTRLVVDQDMTGEYVDYMQRTWPLALARLKALCEAKA
ncbi:MAG: SRPBCC domain-containing protein [Burkholderiales bacterium]|uniref:SRPBCC family protein n=1 Tax=Inhella sp. TaxID=1921806 RepID=UPI001AD03B4C|nr:SRPBCC domain-containing protein [Burkholderiales bacterium]